MSIHERGSSGSSKAQVTTPPTHTESKSPEFEGISEASEHAAFGTPKWTAKEIADACVRAGLGIFECNALLVTLKATAPSAPVAQETDPGGEVTLPSPIATALTVTEPSDSAEAWKAMLKELVDAMRRYEMDADSDGPQPLNHRDMMRRAEAMCAGAVGVGQVAVPEDWKLMPRKASQEHVEYATYDINRKHRTDIVTPELVKTVYETMIFALPAAPAETRK